MIRKRVFRDLIEFAILSSVWIICFSNIRGGHHDVVTPLLFFGYALGIILNFIAQVTISARSFKNGLKLKFQRFKLFSFIFSLPIIGFIYFGELDILLFPLIITVVTIFYYIALNLLIHILKLVLSEQFNVWLKNRQHKIYLITAVLLFLIPHIIAYFSFEQMNTHEKLWKRALKSDSVYDYEVYLKKSPEGKHHEQFTFKLADKLDSLDAYEDYISQYPNGKYLFEYKFNIARLTRDSNLVDSLMKVYGNTNYKNQVRELKFMINNSPDTFIDNRDGNIYKTIKVGNQIWMTENLRYKTVNSKTYSEIVTGELNYGEVYNTLDATSVCPKGWHLPTRNEWITLRDTLLGFQPSVGYYEYSCNYLKSRKGWEKFNGNDAVGFSAYPTGYIEVGGHLNDEFDVYRKGIAAYWWSLGSNKLSYWELHSLAEYKLKINKNIYLPIRCVRN